MDGIVQTPNLKLNRIPANRKVWAESENQNFVILDAAFGAYFQLRNLRGVWANNTVYAVGDSAIDEDTSVVYVADIAHTSAAVGTTFAEERAAHPTYWHVYSSPATARGVWQQHTAYALNDFVVYGPQYAICIETHVSGEVFATDVAGGKWSILIDLTNYTTTVLPVLTGISDANKFAVTASDGESYIIVSGSTVFDMLGFGATGKLLAAAETPAEGRAILSVPDYTNQFYNVYSILDYAVDRNLLLAGTEDLGPAIVAAHAAMPSNGAILWLPSNATYSLRSSVSLTKPCMLKGGGQRNTLINVGNTFAHSGGSAIKVMAESVSLRDFTIYGVNADTTQDYNAIHTDTGCGLIDFQNITVRRCGRGFYFQVAHVGQVINCSVYEFTVDGYKFGEKTAEFCSELRVFGGVINNGNSTQATNGVTASGDTLHFADTSSFTVGMEIAGINITAGTTVIGKTSNTVQLSANVTGAILNGQYIRYGSYLQGVCIHIGRNAFDNNFTDMLIAGGKKLIEVEGIPDVPGGFYRPDSVFFNNMNATASTYFGIHITGGTNVHINDSHIGDCLGAMLLANASSSVAADVSNIHITDTLVGGALTHGAYFDFAKNIFFENAKVVGNGIYVSDTYNGVHCTANCEGGFSFIGGYSGNKEVDNAAGAVAHGVFLDAGSFGGAGDWVYIDAPLDGLTAAWRDGSDPVPPLKTVQPAKSPFMKAWQDAGQTIGAAAGFVKVNLAGVVYDSQDDNCNTPTLASGRWTPPAGTYMMHAQVSIATQNDFEIAIYRNSVDSIAQQAFFDENSGNIAVFFTASGTDYFEVFINVPTGDDIVDGLNATFFFGR